jgi:hypothetical protein
MCVRIYRTALGRMLRPWLLRGSAALALICCIGLAGAQVQLPEVLVRGAKPKPKPAAAARARATPAAAVRPAPVNLLATQTAALNQGLNTIYAPTGTAPTTISHKRDRGAAARRERHGREDRAPVSWSYPGFGPWQQFPRPQRACQCADPHQRHHAS